MTGSERPTAPTAVGSLRAAAAKGWTLADLPSAARGIDARLREHGLGDVDGQVLWVVEEAGEFAGAYRRWTGRARRPGTHAEMSAELADVVIAAAVAAHRIGIDLEAAVAAKVGVVHDRGWREGRADGAGAQYYDLDAMRAGIEARYGAERERASRMDWAAEALRLDAAIARLAEDFRDIASMSTASECVRNMCELFATHLDVIRVQPDEGDRSA